MQLSLCANPAFHSEPLAKLSSMFHHHQIVLLISTKILTMTRDHRGTDQPETWRMPKATRYSPSLLGMASDVLSTNRHSSSIHVCVCMYVCVYAATCINVFADWEATLHHLDSGGGPVMQPGMIFTIEPILTAGSTEWIMWNDGWTVATVDQSRTAQYEHTLLITPTGVEILTLDKAT
jgi:hypothetical protein